MDAGSLRRTSILSGKLLSSNYICGMKGFKILVAVSQEPLHCQVEIISFPCTKKTWCVASFWWTRRLGVKVHIQLMSKQHERYCHLEAGGSSPSNDCDQMGTKWDHHGFWTPEESTWRWESHETKILSIRDTVVTVTGPQSSWRNGQGAIRAIPISIPQHSTHSNQLSQTLHVCNVCLHWPPRPPQCRHIWHTWSVWVIYSNQR